MRDWNALCPEEQAAIIVKNFIGLDEDDMAVVFDEWSQGVYLDTPMAHITAQADLQRIAQLRLLEKYGRHKAEESRLAMRVRRGLQKWLEFK
jgi:hypothetical protein